MDWHTEQKSCLLPITAPTKKELFTVASLTQRLSDLGTFSVQVLAQGKQNIRPDEAAILGHKSLMHVREVLLFCDNVPVVFARTVLPLSAIRRELRQLITLGNTSLGMLLHTSRHIQSGVSEVGLVSEQDCLYPSQQCSGDGLWARRTIYRSYGSQLLVTEVLLPTYWEQVVAKNLLG